jgi:hypothetical protein
MQNRCTVKAMLLIASAPFVMSSVCFAGDLPDPVLTLGATNCVRGWSKSVRPPAYYTNRLKKLLIR